MAKYSIRVIDTSGILRISVVQLSNGLIVFDCTWLIRQGGVLNMPEFRRAQSQIKDLIYRYKCNVVVTNCKPIEEFVIDIKGGGVQ